MFITCDLYYLKHNYILHFRGNDITSKFIEEAKKGRYETVQELILNYEEFVLEVS